MKFEFNAKVTDGKLHIINRKQFDELLGNELNRRDLILTVERKRSKRSLSQNAYYYAGVLPIIQEGFKELGYKMNKEETHEFLKNKFLSVPLEDKDNVFIGNKVRSTTSLNKSEFADYIADIAQWAAEILNCVVPPPLEQQTFTYQ